MSHYRTEQNGTEQYINSKDPTWYNSQGCVTCHIINTRQYKCNYIISVTVVMQDYQTYHNGNIWQNNVALFKNISVNVCIA